MMVFKVNSLSIRSLVSMVVFLALIVSCDLKKEDSVAVQQPVTKEPPSELFKTIARLDSLMISVAQRDCDLETYESFLSEDFEYFHDKGGFTPSKEAEMADMAIFCGPEQRGRQPLRRQLTQGTLEVYPMDKYGALQFCDHTFYLQINDGTEKLIGSGKMTALWKKEDNGWKVTRIISYDHQPLAEMELSQETLNQYVGDYLLPDRVVNIKKEGKFLRATDVNDGIPGWNTLLFAESENKFYFNYENVVYEFIKEGSAVISLNIIENGKVIEEAKRE